MPITEFPQSVIEQLKTYVYMLIDPRDGQVFYIGKGKGNRVFQHAQAAVNTDDKSEKLDRIRAIIALGQEVDIIIHRHGLTDKEAFEVEASLIDYIGMTNLANIVQGHHRDARGRMSVADILALYTAPEIKINENVILITVNQLYDYGLTGADLYDATRGNWVIGVRRNKADYAFAVYRGIVRAVYRIHEWEAVGQREPDQKTRNRWRFSGAIAPELQHYVGGNVSRFIGQNPIRYINC